MDDRMPVMIIRIVTVTKKEVEQRGWTELDVILISGDAYIDHPSFGSAVISRILEKMVIRSGCENVL